MPAALISTAFHVYAVLQGTPPSCLFLKGFTSSSLGLSPILKKVAGGSGCLCPTPLPAPRPRRWERSLCLFCFTSGIMFIVVQNQSTLQSGCMSILQGSGTHVPRACLHSGSISPWCQPPAGTSLPTLPILSTPLLSSWRWAGHSSHTGFPGCWQEGAL